MGLILADGFKAKSDIYCLFFPHGGVSNGDVVKGFDVQHIFNDDLIIAMHTMITCAAGAAASANFQNRDDFTRHPLFAFVCVVEPFPDEAGWSIEIRFISGVSSFRRDE